MYTRFVFHVSALLILLFISSCKKDKVEPTNLTPPAGTIALEASTQRMGDPDKGYEYLIYGDFIDSGIPLDLYLNTLGSGVENLLNRTGDNAKVNHDFTAVDAFNGARVAVANCFACHAQKLNGELIIGLGNSLADYTLDQSQIVPFLDATIKSNYGEESKEWEAFQPFRKAIVAVGPEIKLNIRGVNPADKITAVLAAHRYQDDLSWDVEELLEVPDETIPSDVPAWWLLKKKNAMFATGVGQGDFARLMMASSILTLQDSTKAREVDEKFVDVVAFINSIEPPKFPQAIDQEMADRGEMIFYEKCAKCHGTYGAEETYPNLLIPLDLVQTDPVLTQSNFAYPVLVNWYNGSWFGQAPNAAKLVPYEGYVAPPLDGVWATAPYLHNGAVSTLEDLLNSVQRPTYFKRAFDESDYNFETVGWNYEVQESGGDSNIFDTTLKGYGNGGHRFGDSLNEMERKDLIEYLKTL